MTSTRKTVQGLVFVAVLLLLVGLAIGKYVGVFQSGIPVTLKVDRIGNQLADGGDVKVRGLIVGSIKQVSTTGDGATVQLSIDPKMADQIPADVTARLLPKTLFGEKYVSLVPPADAGRARIAAGDVIGEDRSQSAREVDQVLNDLLPLLQAVKPDKLATTLGSLSQALQGRGTELGQTLVGLNTLLNGVNPSIPDLQADVTQLADFADNLSQASPDLLNALNDFTVTSKTIVEKKDGISDLLSTLTGASDDLNAFLDANGENLIGLTATSRPTLATLARYAPEFPCLFGQLSDIIPRVDAVFGKGTNEPGVHITAEIVNNRGKYVPGEEPRYLDDRGPRCYPIVVPGPQFPPDGPFRDGSKTPTPPVGTPGPGYTGIGRIPPDYSALPNGTGANGSGAKPARYDMGVPNSPGERQVVNELVAAQQGTSPQAVPNWSTMLVGPLYRGSEVTLT
ncbi:MULTISPECIES: MCE family protein [unclassified Pseudonocardia]|uniref:MCE family protein n=1 Tax=unclassified Pseudonocardia TaxID=2619320 RepID=UPI000965CC82|nr:MULTISPECIES: MCE family protein [unclassified Pseudonocardia]MBN9098291.1 MCE family protein [Pseudonocardia sp.]OJY52540.1 MAG: mammalian cell entry protein [Pseudonocardia sp. 73-21]